MNRAVNKALEQAVNQHIALQGYCSICLRLHHKTKRGTDLIMFQSSDYLHSLNSELACIQMVATYQRKGEPVCIVLVRIDSILCYCSCGQGNRLYGSGLALHECEDDHLKVQSACLQT